MDVFKAARNRIENFADTAPKCNGILTVKHLANVFAKDWRVNKGGAGDINLYRSIEDGCEYATVSLYGDGLGQILTQSEIQDGLPEMLRFQAD